MNLKHETWTWNIKHELVSRQYLLGSKNSRVTETVDLLDFYHLPSLGELLADLPSKHEWKKQVKDVITCHWYGKMAKEIPEKSSLKFLSTQTEHLSHIHPVWQTTISDSWRSQHARTRVKLLTGTYTLQANLARFMHASKGILNLPTSSFYLCSPFQQNR